MGEVADIIGGGTPSTKNPEYWDGDIDWYSPVEIGSRIYLNGSRRKITQTGLKNSSAKILPKNTVLFTSRAGIGKTAILTKEGATNQGFQSIVPREKLLDSYFIFSKTNSLKKYGERQGAGSTFVEVSRKQMEKMPLFIPSLNEQIKISNFFKSLDNHITLHQRKINILKELKQEYLRLMFANNEHFTPMLRFKQFEKDWEERQLKDVSERVTRKNKDNISTLPLTISAQDGLVDQNTYYKKQIASRDMSHYYLLKNGDFAYNKSYSNGFPLGVVKRLDKYEYGALSTLYIVFRPKQIYSDFLLFYYETNKWHKEVLRLSAEGARNHGLLNISVKDFFDTKMRIPISEKEQVEIGAFLMKLEKHINIQHRKISTIKKLKKTYLQKMFL